MMGYWKPWRNLNICWDSIIVAEEQTVGTITEREQKSVNDDYNPQNLEVKKIGTKGTDQQTLVP